MPACAGSAGKNGIVHQVRLFSDLAPDCIPPAIPAPYFLDFPPALFLHLFPDLRLSRIAPHQPSLQTLIHLAHLPLAALPFLLRQVL